VPAEVFLAVVEMYRLAQLCLNEYQLCSECGRIIKEADAARETQHVQWTVEAKL